MESSLAFPAFNMSTPTPSPISPLLFSAQLYPGRALGWLVLGGSLHDILTRLKTEPQRFPNLDVKYSPTDPTRSIIVIELPANGMRLHFDAPEQRLRLIEVVDFTKNHIFIKAADNKERDLVRPSTASTPSTDSPAGPTFRHIYQRFLGPTYNGEFVDGPNTPDNAVDQYGLYMLSWPGVAFSFLMKKASYTVEKNVVDLLPSTQVPEVMAIFSGDSWTQARQTLWTEVLPSLKTFTPLTKGKEVFPDEVSLIKIYGGGKLHVFRKWTDQHFWIRLGQTTPQDLVSHLGPPDAIYRKNDHKMFAHNVRTDSDAMKRPDSADLKHQDDLTDTDQSSANAGSDGYHSSDDETSDVSVEGGHVSGECFYNYFFHGFDVLVSRPTAPSAVPPSQEQGKNVPNVPKDWLLTANADSLVATKIVLHGNVPGSYPFNRHRRCRWEIPYLSTVSDVVINSESDFPLIEESLRKEWQSIYPSEEEACKAQRGMVLNRGWGDSPGSSIEFLGGWEGDGATAAPDGGGTAKKFDGPADSTTTLYGFPGLVFEVLKNGAVTAVTVY